MSKLLNELRLIQILKNQGITKIEELSDLLDVSQRMIRKYKSDINKSKVAYVEWKAGKQGGLYISDVMLTDSEIILLYNLLEYLKVNNYPAAELEKFKIILEKIKYKFYEDF